jgi:hypothetical protein
MKLTPEQLGDWFFTANPRFPAAFRDQWFAELKMPPAGTKKSEIVSGMKQGINDTLTKAKWMSPEERAMIDAALITRGLPSLRKMDAVLRKKHQRILARGCIRTDEEFYVVAEFLSDGGFDVTDSERAKLGEICYAYETRRKSDSV